jgi:hypothetical protein
VLPSGGSSGALLVSLFNVKWRCYAQAGGVEESKFCLFWVVFPVRYISSVSPRFYFRRPAFCFLLLAAILDTSLIILCIRYFYRAWLKMYENWLNACQFQNVPQNLVFF